ncbi:MAG: DNA-binding protein [Crocinitomicaceae bacterium]|nr:DNA-binding protein [Crocinitomicaceae bacterium]
MEQIQLIQVTPNELADIISENVKTQIQELAKGLNNSNQESHKEILSRKEVAELFGVSLVTIHDWINTGILAPYKIGGRTFFKRSDLMQLLISAK